MAADRESLTTQSRCDGDISTADDNLASSGLPHSVAFWFADDSRYGPDAQNAAAAFLARVFSRGPATTWPRFSLVPAKK
jgi:hypothetical protein